MTFYFAFAPAHRAAPGIFCAVLITLLGFSNLRAQSSKEDIQSYLENLVEVTGFEGVVLLAENGAETAALSRGFSDTKRGAPLTKEQLFPVASITKLVTAIAVLQLSQEGKLDLNEPINDFLPEFELPWPVNAHQLLLHISGLPNESDDLYLNGLTLEQMVTQTLAKAKKKRKKDTFNYNNVDYLLLGALLSKIEKKPWEVVLRERILTPAGMVHSGFLSEGFPDGLSKTFRPVSDSYLPDPPIAWENYYAAGNMYATARDLLALDQALYSDILLNDKSKDLLYTSYPEYNYSGYSVWTFNYPFLPNQPLLMERRGGILGFNGVLLRILDQNKTLIILNNNGTFNPDSFGDESNLKEALIRAWAGPE